MKRAAIATSLLAVVVGFDLSCGGTKTKTVSGGTETETVSAATIATLPPGKTFDFERQMRRRLLVQ